MVTLPKQFIATKYPGYFWCSESKKLFSLKSGELKELTLVKPSRWTNGATFYVVSVKGTKKWLTLGYLKKLTDSNVEIGIFKS